MLTETSAFPPGSRMTSLVSAVIMTSGLGIKATNFNLSSGLAYRVSLSACPTTVRGAAGAIFASASAVRSTVVEICPG